MIESITLEQAKKMCLYKRVYETRSEAKRLAKLTQKSYGERRHRCRVYRCAICSFWHVTSKPADAPAVVPNG